MRYQFTSQGYLNSLKKINKLTIVHQLLIINIIIFILMIMSHSCYDWINQYCALHINDNEESTKIWQFLTSAFVHQTYYHDEIVINEKYGKFRGTGVLSKVDGMWKIDQYNLLFPIPNDLLLKYTKEVKEYLKNN